jgi:hypothetical protein
MKSLVPSVMALAMLVGCDDKRSQENRGPAAPDRSYGRKCPAYTACGGDLVGTWELADYCAWIDPGFGSKECSIHTWYDGEATGTMTFNADGSYVTNVTRTNVYIEDSPEISVCGGGRPVGGFDGPDGGAPSPPDSGLSECQERERIARIVLEQHRMPLIDAVSVSCASQGGRCACTWVEAPTSEMKSGTYSTKGSALTLDGAPRPYCVKGNELFFPGSASEYGSSSSRLVRQR